MRGGGSVVIRATATGEVTGTYVYSAGIIGALTAARDDRTFYFVEDAQSTATVKTFRITASAPGWRPGSSPAPARAAAAPRPPA